MWGENMDGQLGYNSFIMVWLDSIPVLSEIDPGDDTDDEDDGQTDPGDDSSSPNPDGGDGDESENPSSTPGDSSSDSGDGLATTGSDQILATILAATMLIAAITLIYRHHGSLD